MRSIPLAMTLDTLRRGAWSLPAMFLAANALPLILLTALRGAGALDPDDPSQIIMHMVLTQISMWVFGVAVLSSQGPVSKMFTLPVATAMIVFWRMLALVILAAGQCLLSTLLINALFGVDWPLWGPALLLAVAMAAVQAIVWYADKSLWTVVLLALLALGYGIWMKSHYGGLFSQPDHYWREVTLADAAVMSAMLALTYGLGVVGVARNRRGEPPLSLGIVDWVQRLLPGKAGATVPFRSPAAAHFWYEWRKKGWMMPAGAAFGLLLALVGWLIFNRNPRELWEGAFALGGCLTILGVIGGLIMGHNGPNDANYDLGGFLATRPLATTALANILLRAWGLSLLLSWLIWAVAFAGAFIVLASSQGTLVPLLPEKLHWAYFPATLLGPWVAATLLACMGLSGRIVRFIQFGGALLAAWIGLTLISNYALSSQGRAFVEITLAIALGTLCLIGTLAAFVAAWRRGLVGWGAVYLAGSLWIALTAATLLTLINESLTPLQMVVGGTIISGLLALAVAPLATAPLALAWNRNR